MQVRTPSAYPRDDGDFNVTGNGGRGDPFAMIELSEDGALELVMQTLEDCDRLARASAMAKEEILRRREAARLPHSFRATKISLPCLECGKDEADELHAEPLSISDETIRQAEALAQPGNTVADVLAGRAALAASIASGVPLVVYDDEPRCKCGHLRSLHEDVPDGECRAVACGCDGFSDAASEAS